MDPISSISQQNNSPQYNPNYFCNSVRINADNSNKKAVLVFWLIFAIFQIIVFITSNFTPESLTIKTNQTELSSTTHNQCQNPIEFTNGMLSCRPFSSTNPKLGLIMRNLSPLNQFAQINLLYLPKKVGSSIIKVKQDFAFELLSLNRKQVIINQNEKKWMFEEGVVVKKMEKVQFDSSQTSIQQLDWYNGTHQRGFDIKLGYFRQFVSVDALLIITFLNFDKQSLQNYQIIPVATLMSQSYTKFILIFRGIFLGLTTLSFVFFFRQHKEVGPSLQHTIVLFLSGAIILFNDPYYFIQVFQPNLISLFVSTVFIAVFFIVLILSWISFLEKIKTEGEGAQFLILPNKKIVYGVISSLFFIVIFIINFQIGYYSFSQSPIIPNHFTFNGLYIFLSILLSVLFLYIIFLYFGIIRNWSKIIWRNKIYVTFNIFFILLNFVFIWLGWFSFYAQSSQKFQIFYASMNFYVIYLQYMYSLPFEKKQETRKEYVEHVEEGSEINNQNIIGGCITIQLQQQSPKISQLSQ